jgi:cell division protein FtsX
VGASRPSKPKRWGLRTLAYLGIATVSIIASNLMHLNGNDDYVLLPFIGLVVGLVGATVCSVRGIRAWGGRLPRE